MARQTPRNVEGFTGQLAEPQRARAKYGFKKPINPADGELFISQGTQLSYYNKNLRQWQDISSLVLAEAGVGLVARLDGTGTFSGNRNITGSWTFAQDVVIGDTSQESATANLETHTTAADFGGVAVYNWQNGATFGALTIAKAKGGAVGNYATVAQDDGLGGVYFYGADGDEFHLAAGIIAYADAAVGNDDMPGRLVLATTPDGGTSLAEALRISSDQTTTLAGVLSLGDNDITNVGDIALDSISSDGATITIGTDPSIVLTDGTTVAMTLGNDAGDDFTIDSTALVVSGDSGDIGMGTATPQYALSISRPAGTAIISLNRADSTISAGNTIGRLYFTGDDGATEGVGAGITAIAQAGWSTNDYPTALYFQTAPDGGTITTRLYISQSGSVGIPTTTPSAKLHITETTEQLRLEHTAGVDYASFTVDSNGYINIDPTGDFVGINITPTEELEIHNTAFVECLVSSERNTSTIGRVGFDGRDSASARQKYAGVKAEINTNTATNETGILHLETVSGGSFGNRLTVLGSDVGINCTPACGFQVSIQNDYVDITDSGDSNESRVRLGDSSGNGGYIALTADDGTIYAMLRSYAISNTQAYFTAGRVGFGDTTPDTQVEVAATTEQLRLSYTAGSIFSSFTCDANGTLTINTTGGTPVVKCVRTLSIENTAPSLSFVDTTVGADDFSIAVNTSTFEIKVGANTTFALQDGKWGMYGTTPVAQPTAGGVTAGFTAGASTPVLVDSTFTGNTGATAYTIGDIVKALKDIGVINS